MKHIAITLTIASALFSFAGEAATILCAKSSPASKTLYPYNKEAITLAAKLGLKTCNRSDRFKVAAKAAKHVTTFKTVSKVELKTARAALLKAMNNGETAGTF